MDAGGGGQYPWHDLIPLIFENVLFQQLRLGKPAGPLRPVLGLPFRL